MINTDTAKLDSHTFSKTIISQKYLLTKISIYYHVFQFVLMNTTCK